MSESEKPATTDGAPAEPAAPANAAAPQSPPPATPEPPRPVRSGRALAGLALIVALGALLGSGYLWYELIYRAPAQAPPPDLSQELAQIERRTGETRAALDELRATVAELEPRFEGLAETQRTLRAAIDNLQASIGRNQTQWQLAEAEQLLLIANRRLQLGRDVDSALAALRAADRQLERLANPNLLPVRREIAREVAALQALERADISGIALRLGSLAERTDQLPVDPDLERRAQQVAAAGGNQADGGVWQDLLSLVRIRRHDEPQKPLLAPEHRYFARQNLRLMLYGAQHALLQGNVATYEQNLATAGGWLEQYFDPHAAAVRAAREEIAKLREVEVARELPDISASLEMLRRAQAAREDAS